MGTFVSIPRYYQSPLIFRKVSISLTGRRRVPGRTARAPPRRVLMDNFKVPSCLVGREIFRPRFISTNSTCSHDRHEHGNKNLQSSIHPQYSNISHFRLTHRRATHLIRIHIRRLALMLVAILAPVYLAGCGGGASVSPNYTSRVYLYWNGNHWYGWHGLDWNGLDWNGNYWNRKHGHGWHGHNRHTAVFAGWLDADDLELPSRAIDFLPHG